MIAIENMEMPKSCEDCRIKDDDYWCFLICEYCDTLAAWAARCRPEKCPLIDLTDDGR